MSSPYGIYREDVPQDNGETKADSRNRETILPIYWKGWDLLDTLIMQFDHVEFYEDWGPFKVGDCVESVSLNLERGIVAVYGNDNEMEIRVVLRPKSEGA